ncbi:hypothetical protein DH2020_042584 [Rehmannia glutinosa]|uniref:JmjC domain-containing protein n=1 Tax=Rehmannia glutinosa TaxID=99300 RepID=A0ABR0UN22_REHGL
MAAEVNGGGNIEVSPWLKSMPVAPEYHPTLAEFQDPIAYIFKIEKEASKYVPFGPVQRPESGPTFTTRQQQIGFCPRKHCPVQKPVWQSGEKYTLTEFEAKAKGFEKNYLKKYVKKGLNALEIETLYWNAMVDKPFPVEYANDMPGSAFVVQKSGRKKNEGTMTVGETEWNMRRVSRDNLSLLRFMKEEIPGVTSPMVYVAMMFSWFAWHVEDHDLHSMNYLHMGAGKTWVRCATEAAVAFEEVIREHGYGGEINPLVTFATLGEKTTVMSPEVLLNAGVPCCRVPKSIATEPRSSRLKDRKKGEGETLIKELFFKDMMQNNDTLHTLGKGSSIVLLPQNSLSRSICSNTPSGFQSTAKSRLFPSLCSPDLEVKQARGCAMNRRAVSSLCSSEVPYLVPHAEQMDSELKKASQHEQGLFSCVTCGILCFACVAIVQPTEAAARYLMSADIFNCLGASDNDHSHIIDAKALHTNIRSELVLGKTQSGLGDIPISADQLRSADESVGVVSNSKARDETEADIPVEGCGTSKVDSPENGHACDNTDSKINCTKGISLQISELQTKNCREIESDSLTRRFRHQMGSRQDISNSLTHNTEAKVSTGLTPIEDTTMPFPSRSDEDSSRLHVFCLQHAMQVEKRLSEIGGARVFLVCHPDYPKLESQAKKVAEELESDSLWSEISFRAATEEDEEVIQLALESENAIHGNGDWAVKLGINLFYSANLSRSPLYCKQMHYNFIIYSAFGRSSPTESSTNKGESESKGRQKKIVVAGKWCGKVWMSSQAHPLLVKKDLQEHELDIGIDALIKPSLKFERQFCRTSRRKKNNAGNNSSRVKEKSIEAGKIDESSLRGLRTRRLKEENPEPENSDSESQPSDSCKQIKTKGRTKRLKKETFEAENLNESSEEFPLSNSWKRINSKRGGARPTKGDTEPLKNQQKSKKQINSLIEGDELEGGPSTRLRKRTPKPCKDSGPNWLNQN